MLSTQPSVVISLSIIRETGCRSRRTMPATPSSSSSPFLSVCCSVRNCVRYRLL